MKRFDKLSDAEKERAIAHHMNKLLKAIVEGHYRFNDELNGDDLQARIDRAIATADKKQTPWFAHEYIMETCRSEIEGMSRCDAEDSLYAEPGEYVVHGIIRKE